MSKKYQIIIILVMIIFIILAFSGGFQFGASYQKHKDTESIREALELRITGIECINGRIVSEKDYEGFKCEDGFWRIRIPNK